MFLVRSGRTQESGLSQPAKIAFSAAQKVFSEESVSEEKLAQEVVAQEVVAQEVVAQEVVA